MSRSHENASQFYPRWLGPVLVPGRHPVLHILRLWHQRHCQRNRLKDLDDFMLRDIGIDRQAAAREARKPFWQA